MRQIQLNSLSIFMGSAIAMLSMSSVSAHHGFAQYYDRDDQVRIEGTVHSISIRNPHTRLEVEVAGADGSSVIWSCETQAKSLMDRKGITTSDFVVGDPIVVTGSRARQGVNGCEVGTVYFSNGESITFRSDQGRAAIDVNDTAQVSAGQRTSIFGLWVLDNFAGIPTAPGFLDAINETGRAASDQYDSFRDDPPLHCKPGTPVRAWAAPGNPTEIRSEGDKIIIQHEFMDTSRTIYMDPATTPTNMPRSGMGFSTGRFNGDELVVETGNFTEGVLLTHVGSGNGGVVHSDGLKLVERFKLDTDGNLIISWKATDSKYFSGPISGTVLLSATALEVGKYDCEITIAH